MKTIKTIRDDKEFGSVLAEFFTITQDNHVVELVARYRRKQPILLKKGTSKCYPVYASPDHPKSKEIHEYVIRMDIKAPSRHHRRHQPYHRRERRLKK
jgi:hypothetical protein